MGLAGLGLLIAVTGTVAWMTLVDAGEGNGPATAGGTNTGGSRALQEYLDSLIDPLRQPRLTTEKTGGLHSGRRGNPDRYRHWKYGKSGISNRHLNLGRGMTTA